MDKVETSKHVFLWFSAPEERDGQLAQSVGELEGRGFRVVGVTFNAIRQETLYLLAQDG